MPKMHSNGEGYLHKRPNGLWECQIMVGYQADGRKKMKSFYGKNRKKQETKQNSTLIILRSRLWSARKQPFLSGLMSGTTV